MLKRLGVLVLMASAAGAVFTPAAAFAQDRYEYSGRDQAYYDRHDREHERREARERREHERREHERRERERRECERQWERGYYR